MEMANIINAKGLMTNNKYQREINEIDNVGDEETERDLISSINCLQDILEEGEVTDHESMVDNSRQIFSKSFSDSDNTLEGIQHVAPSIDDVLEDEKSIDLNLMNGLHDELLNLMTSFKNSMKDKINQEFQQRIDLLEAKDQAECKVGEPIKRETPSPISDVSRQSKEFMDKKISMLKSKHARHIADLKTYYEDRLGQQKREGDVKEKELLREIESLQAEDSGVVEELEKVKKQYAETLKTINETENQLKANNLTFQRWRKQNTHSTAIINELNSKIDKVYAENYENDKTIDMLRVQCSTLQDELNASLHKTTIWKEKFTQECNKYEKICCELRASADENDRLSQQLTSTEDRVNELSDEVSRLHLKLKARTVDPALSIKPIKVDKESISDNFNSPVIMAQDILRRSKMEDIKTIESIEANIYEEDTQMHTAITAALERIRDGKIFSKTIDTKKDKSQEHIPKPDEGSILKVVDKLKGRMNELISEKNELLSCLSKVSSIFGSGKVSLRNKQRKEEIEIRLDEIDRELGSVRMNLKKYHVL